MSGLLAILFGKFFNAGLAFLVSIIAARMLGVEDFGVFTVSMSVVVITLELSGSESIDNGFVRLASEYRSQDEQRCHAIVQAALTLKLASGTVLLMGCWLLWDRGLVLLC